MTTTTTAAGLASASVFLPGGGACEVTVDAINTGSNPFSWGQVLGVNGAPTGTWMYLSGDSNAAETGFTVPAGGWASAPVGQPGDTLDTGAGPYAVEGSTGVYWAIWCGGSQSAPHATGEF